MGKLKASNLTSLDATFAKLQAASSPFTVKPTEVQTVQKATTPCGWDTHSLPTLARELTAADKISPAQVPVWKTTEVLHTSSALVPEEPANSLLTVSLFGSEPSATTNNLPILSYKLSR